MTRRIVIVAALLVSLGVVATPAQAILLPATDLGDLNLTPEQRVKGPLPTDIWTPDLSGQGGSAATDIGNLVGSVFLSGGVYTYVFEVTPQVSLGFKEFNTSFNVLGFDSTTLKVGYSFSQASAAGPAAGSDLRKVFSIRLDSDGTIDWVVPTVQRAAGFWSAMTPISFFFQSTSAPENGDQYNVLGTPNGGSATNYHPVAPVPEPGTLLLLGSGFVGAAGLRAFRRKR